LILSLSHVMPVHCNLDWWCQMFDSADFVCILVSSVVLSLFIYDLILYVLTFAFRQYRLILLKRIRSYRGGAL
jgi:hypothetical protein